MKESKLTEWHFCFAIFLEMSVEEFVRLLQTNSPEVYYKFLDARSNLELYEEAKESMLNKRLGGVDFDFDYDTEPFVFNKYINGKLDRAYKICIFEISEREISFSGKTSDAYCNGLPLFYDLDGNLIKNSLN